MPAFRTPQKSQKRLHPRPYVSDSPSQGKKVVVTPPGHRFKLADLDKRLRLARGSLTSEHHDTVCYSREESVLDQDLADMITTKSVSTRPSVKETPMTFSLPSIDFDALFERHKESLAGTSPLPTKRTKSVFDRWAVLLPQLVTPYLGFVSSTKGKHAIFPSGTIQTNCSTPSCSRQIHRVLCLFPCEHEYISVTWCKCRSISRVLMDNGLFPGTPTRPNMAFSIVLLKLYHSIFLRTADSVNSFSDSMDDFYNWRGYSTMNSQGCLAGDPYRRPLGLAFIWFTKLLDNVDKVTENALALAETQLRLRQRAVEMTCPSFQISPSVVRRTLRDRCPACFGGDTFGRSLSDGGDIHVAVDGNFNHRHLRSVLDCPQFHSTDIVLSKEEIDQVGRRLESKRKRRVPAKKRVAPDDAIDGCQNAHTAGSGSNAKTDIKRFDAGGLMGLVCRHDIPLFAANIDTAGEQQKYAVALIEHLMKLLPPNATVVVLYDVGCVLDRTLDLYHVLEDDIQARLRFGTSALHAYAHQWACQLVYNPRLQDGLGLTDGEGVERLWSCMRHLISVTRTCSGNRRLFLVDQQMKFLGHQIVSRLDTWLTRKLEKSVHPKLGKSSEALRKSGLSAKELQEQWVLQRQSQLDVRRFSSAEAKKRLQKALEREAEIEIIDTHLKTLDEEDHPLSSGTSQLQGNLSKIREIHDERLNKFYGSLDIASQYPRLADIDFSFLTKLVFASDLKVAIRDKVIGSLFEWDRIDQASGGRDQAIGTKAHQSARQSISRRKTAMVNLINKYNEKCGELERMYQPGWNIPLPARLPLNLAGMRDHNAELMQDIWMEDTSPPKWISDNTVREGIQHHLTIQRCGEEVNRLQLEASNLLRWLAEELVTVEIAISASSDLIPILLDRRKHLHNLGRRWSKCPLIPNAKLEATLRLGTTLAQPYSKTEHQTKDGNDNTSSPWRVACLPDNTELSHDDDCEEDPFPAIDRWGEAELADEIQSLDISSDTPDSDSQGHSMTLETPSRLSLASIEAPATRIIWSLSPSHRVLSENGLFATLRLANPEVDRVGENQTVGDVSPRRLNRSILFNEATISRMREVKALLCDLCINPLAELIQHKLIQHPATLAAAEGCALFTTFSLPMFRVWKDHSDCWNHHQHLEYWRKPMWIIPIHRPGGKDGHWVSCTISFRHQEIYLFDSFASRGQWDKDLEDLIPMISSLQRSALKRNMPVIPEIGNQSISWTARPALLVPRQVDQVSCGLWVLASITASLCGYTGVGLTTEKVKPFRELLLRYILSLPLSVAS